MAFRFHRSPAPWLRVLLILALSSCGQPTPTFDAGYTRISASQLNPQAPIPLPTAPPLLTVSGRIQAKNQGDNLLLDRQTIEALGLVEMTVMDPFESVSYQFRGVLMRDLLNLWQVDPQAKTLQIRALDSYQIEIPIDVLRDYPVIFALQQNGQDFQPNYRGPAMLVFPYEAYPMPEGYTEQYWVWQIKTIIVR